MKWTKEQPTKPGWYWARDMRTSVGRYVRVRHLLSRKNGRLFEVFDDVDYDMTPEPETEWCFIPEPEEA